MASDRPVTEYFEMVEEELQSEAEKIRGNRPEVYQGIEKSLEMCRSCLSPLGGKRAGDSQHVMEITRSEMPSWKNHITELKKLDTKADTEKYRLLKEKLGQVQGECEQVYPSKIDSGRLLSEEFHKIIENFEEPIKELNPSKDSGYVTGFVYVVECHLVALHKLFQDKKYREEIEKSHF